MIIDISHHNDINLHNIDRTKLYGIIVRAYYGLTGEDRNFKKNMQYLKKMKDMPYALYYYSYAKNKEESEKEAIRMDLYLEEASAITGRLPFCVFCDMEDNNNKNSAEHILDSAFSVLNEIAYKNTITFGLYCSESWFNYYYADMWRGLLERYNKAECLLWIAKWNCILPVLRNNIDCHIHQYTSKGTITGYGDFIDKSSILLETLELAQKINKGEYSYRDVPLTGRDETEREDTYMKDYRIADNTFFEELRAEMHSYVNNDFKLGGCQLEEMLNKIFNQKADTYINLAKAKFLPKGID
ncbi:GH25 family lysozyme [Bacteroides acidifaciens]|uniref:GH25 family lysozyme n=1 Tax=Bacteroides acidifaciens TaxID=85831 RepID=UPI0025AE8620|nr:GH25 family lysozyme [Bacteroides acidifaciens]